MKTKEDLFEDLLDYLDREQFRQILREHYRGREEDLLDKFDPEWRNEVIPMEKKNLIPVEQEKSRKRIFVQEAIKEILGVDPLGGKGDETLGNIEADGESDYLPDEGGGEDTAGRPTIEEIEIIIQPDEDPDTSYLEQEDFEYRLEEFERGEFSYVGIFAQATVILKDHLQTFRSGGLFGIESDIGKDYFKEVAQEEIAQLKKELQAYNVDMTGFDELAEGAIAEM